MSLAVFAFYDDTFPALPQGEAADDVSESSTFDGADFEDGFICCRTNSSGTKLLLTCRSNYPNMFSESNGYARYQKSFIKVVLFFLATSSFSRCLQEARPNSLKDWLALSIGFTAVF
jgi:hypothetical protein